VPHKLILTRDEITNTPLLCQIRHFPIEIFDFDGKSRPKKNETRKLRLPRIMSYLFIPSFDCSVDGFTALAERAGCLSLANNSVVAYGDENVNDHRDEDHSQMAGLSGCSIGRCLDRRANGCAIE
jgi:hypothetical protein